MSPMEQGEEFVRATGRYRAQLQHLGVPEVLWSELWQKLKRLGDDGSREEERILSSSLLTLAGPGRPHVVAAREVPADGAIWVVRHTLSEPSGHKLLSRLHADFPLLLRVAEDLQVLDDDEEEEAQGAAEEDGGAEQLSPRVEAAHAAPAPLPVLAVMQPESPLAGNSSSAASDITPDASHESNVVVAADGPPSLKLPHQQHQQEQEQEEEELSAHESVFRAVRQHLHHHVFMCEVQGPSAADQAVRLRYMMEPPWSLMPPSPTPHLHVCPFVLPAGHGTGLQVVSLAWPARDIAPGEPLTRSRLPLGLADYSRQSFWQAAWQGASELEEWYVDALPDRLWGLLPPLPERAASTTSGAAGVALVAGCGSSALGVELLARRTWGRVLAVDYVREVVRLMAGRYPPEAHPGLEWAHGDLTGLDHAVVPDGSVDLVVDKATLDGMCTAEASSSQRWATSRCAGGASAASRYLREMLRVVRRPHGRLVVVTLRGPDTFARMLADLAAEAGATAATLPPSTWWRVEHHLAPEAVEGASAAHCYVCRPCPTSSAVQTLENGISAAA